MDYPEEMYLNDLPEYESALKTAKIADEDFKRYLTEELDQKRTVDEWIQYLVIMSNALSKANDALKLMIGAFVNLNCGDLPNEITKVERETSKVDMNMLRLCHPDIVKSLIEEGKFSISAKDLKSYEEAQDCITTSKSIYYSLRRN